MEERPVCRSCVFGGCKAHPGDTMGYPKPQGHARERDSESVPAGALPVTLTCGVDGKPVQIGWVADLSYLPDLLEDVSGELRDLIVQRGRRQATARRLAGEDTVEVRPFDFEGSPTNGG